MSDNEQWLRVEAHRLRMACAATPTEAMQAVLLAQVYDKIAADLHELERIRRDCSRMRHALISIREFAPAHHDAEPCHVHLHALKIDIPEFCRIALRPEEPA